MSAPHQDPPPIFEQINALIALLFVITAKNLSTIHSDSELFSGISVINNILVLCLGNICRSPMAEGLLKEKFPEKIISSAGLRGMTDWTADPSSVRIMQKHGMDISSHRARNLTRQMIEEADLILTMEAQQTQLVESRFPEARGKVIRLGEYGGYDIADPFNRSLEFFMKTYELIELGVAQLIINQPELNKQENGRAIPKTAT